MNRRNFLSLLTGLVAALPFARPFGERQSFERDISASLRGNLWVMDDFGAAPGGFQSHTWDFGTDPAEVERIANIIAGSSWGVIEPPPEVEALDEVWVTVDGDTQMNIYASGDGIVFVTRDQGATWTEAKTVIAS